MRTKDYEAEYSRTVRIFLASVFLLHILWSRARKGIGSSLSRLVRTTASSPLRHISPTTHNSHCELWPNVRPRILFVVELAIAEMACVSRNIRRMFHVPSGVPVQRSISERDCSHPLVEFVFAEIASTSQTIRTSF